MRQLLLLRHAKSSWDDPTNADHARPLNQRGRRAAAAMRGAMHQLGLQPDLVLVSSARRTLQTLEQLEPWDESPLVEPLDKLYLASADQMIAVLNGVAETVRSVLLIGHNPGMHELALRLAGPAAPSGPPPGPNHARLAAAYPTGALAEFTVTGPWWSVGAEPVKLVRFLAPRDLPELAA